VRSRLREWGMHPRKRYGQHFLISRQILERISEAADLQAEDTVLEIGAGLGDLTALMASMVRQVTALEFDSDLVSRLQERFESVPNVKVLHEDALHWPLPDSLYSHSRPLKVVGNLPYNVATQILMRFSQFPRDIDLMVLMLQKEVAERLVARVDTRAYGGITLMLQLDWDLILAFKIGPAAFHPKPKVESALVVLRPLPVPRVDVGDRRLYQELVKTAFGQRRKTLRNALKGLRPTDRGWSDTLLSRAGIEGSRRAETLCVEEYAHLSRIAKDLMGDRWG
jgi:16S rRNA (adenine1518-N6/adenine1519-N6)-dimethyltransferase